MSYAVSADGTRIAYDATGHGPALVIVGGALSDRRFPKFVKLAGLLATDLPPSTTTAVAAAIPATHRRTRSSERSRT